MKWCSPCTRLGEGHISTLRHLQVVVLMRIVATLRLLLPALLGNPDNIQLEMVLLTSRWTNMSIPCRWATFPRGRQSIRTHSSIQIGQTQLTPSSQSLRRLGGSALIQTP